MKRGLDSIVMDRMTKGLELTTDDRDKLRYVLQAILGDLSKLVILFFIFLSFHQQTAYLMALLSLSLIRLNTGGLHFSTYGRCLGFSFFFFASCLALNSLAPLSDAALLLLGGGSLCVIGLHAPVTSPKRPRYSQAKRLQFRIIGCAVVTLHLIGFWAIKNNPYFTLSIWVIFLQAIQLWIAKEVEHREKKFPF